MRLAGKIALVTGGLSGIGAAVAARFVEEGAQVIAADISVTPGPLGDTAIAPMHVDVADVASVAALLAAVQALHGRLDVLVHCAGIGRNVPFLETTPDMFDQVIAVNLRGTFLVAQAAARAMAASGGGSIVTVSSISGLRGNPGRAAYGASKGGVNILSQVMANELAAHNIRVNVLAPGPVETPLVAAMQAEGPGYAPWLRAIPLGRFAKVEEIASAAVFLASDEASFVTGHVLAVDGGFAGTGVPAR